MPTYSFVCENDDCNFKMERFVSMHHPKKSVCPRCHKNTLIRCIGTGGGIIFKGSGFYETDVKQANDYVKDNDMMNKEREQRSQTDPDF